MELHPISEITQNYFKSLWKSQLQEELRWLQSGIADMKLAAIDIDASQISI
jgi:hypothetical protein